MKIKLTPVASGVALFMASMTLGAHAQEAEKNAAGEAQQNNSVMEIQVTGIRASLQKSMNQKRNAETHVEVVTAEDIGKMPDKNVADSLQRIPGVTSTTSAAGEGGFDENDRISMRGTNPSLTQTLINGHAIGSGDWFVLNQVGSAGRSVSYALLPSELVGRVVVNKTSMASLVEGGTAGNVDIITRRPLEFRKNLTVEGSVGVVYSDLPKKTDPQLTGLFNWKNDQQTLGVLVQAFSEKRSLRRDGQEILGYWTVDPASAAAIAHPDLAGVKYPKNIGSVLFEQTRKRTGGLIDVQFKPSSDLTLNFDAFSSKMDASNYNRNYLLTNNKFTFGANLVPTSYTVRDNTVVQASWAARPQTVTPGTAGATDANSGYTVEYDEISRPDESASTNYFNFDASWRASADLTLNAKAGSTKGTGSTPTQNVAEWQTGAGNSASWTLHGLNAADWDAGATNNAAPASDTFLNWIFGTQNQVSHDNEKYAQIDGDYMLGEGMFTDLKFGLRATKHDRYVFGTIAQGPFGAYRVFRNPADFPNQSNYPSNFGQSIGGNFPKNVWFDSPGDLAAFDAKAANRDPILRRDPGDFDSGVSERTDAAYFQGDFKAQDYSGNAGIRLVKTKTTSTVYLPTTAGNPASVSAGSLFGDYAPTEIENDSTDVLPSLNLKFDLSKNLIARLSLSRTMTRPDYGALASAVYLTDPVTLTGVGTATGPNPYLKPIRSNNADFSLEYYFAPRSLVSVSPFYMDMNSYIGQGVTRQSYQSIGAITGGVPTMLSYDVTSPVNTSARVGGVEFAFDMPFGEHFGLNTNYTYTHAQDAAGGPVIGASKNTGNISPYFENDKFNLRLTYSYRSSYYGGLDNGSTLNQAATNVVSASLGYKINDNLALAFDARNLNNPILRYYGDNTEQTRAVYSNGRQYYLTLRAKM